MNRETAKKIVELAKEAHADRWYVRRPPEDMPKHFGSLPPFLVQRREGEEAYDQEVLAEDYSVTSDELRDKHMEFIMAAAEHLAELAQSWLNENSTHEEDIV